ncbi:hypothetical protein [Streptomyces marispadix]|uniref:HTH marR-type domain-containing protein n=1 Tax=Streptomyces marispadix TaxID=2922868 RepID=A0ABS9T5A8_9ACTN|nr:hypothetical protein [Streptomyces marispadix]MCH6163687.1 hypothetical protein [Streptomyces marispadix]
MMRRADAELIGYLADYHDQARLVLRDVSDTDAALAALERAAEAVWSLPHPDEPDCALPNWCEAALEDGHAVLHMDAKDGAGQIDQIAASILRAIDEAGVGGRLEPFPHREPPPDGLAADQPSGSPTASDSPSLGGSSTPSATGAASAPPATGAASTAGSLARGRVRPRARKVSPGDLGLAVSERGLLYHEGVRAMTGQVLSPWTLVGYETAVAMRAVRDAASAAGRRRGRERRGDGTPPLWPLREHRDGLTLAELCTRMSDGYEELSPVFDQLERTGELVRWHDDSGRIRLRLTERGQRAMDECVGDLAAGNLVLVEDIPAERVGIVRHVCVQAVANSERFARRPESVPSPAAVTDTGKWQLERDGEDRLFVTGLREFTGPLEPEAVLASETVFALGRALSALPRPVPADARTLPVWWLYGCPEGHGIPRTAIEDALGGDGPRVLEELSRAGLVSQSAAPGSADGDDGAAVCRLTEQGRELIRERVRVLEDEVSAAFEGVSMEDLAEARDGCWRIALNRRAAEAA